MNPGTIIGANDIIGCTWICPEAEFKILWIPTFLSGETLSYWVDACKAKAARDGCVLVSVTLLPKGLDALPSLTLAELQKAIPSAIEEGTLTSLLAWG